MKRLRHILVAFTLVFGLLTFSFPSLSEAKVNHATWKTNYKHKKWLVQTKVLAHQGKTLNSGCFGLGSKKQSIIRAWGKPDLDYDTFMVYKKRGISFAFTSNYRVNAILSYDKRLQSITLREVKSTYGKPVLEHDTEGVHVVQYKAGKHRLSIETAIPSKANNYNPKIFVVTVS